MEMIGKFRTFGGKIIIPHEYAYYFFKKLKKAGKTIDQETLEESIFNLEKTFEEEKDYLIEVFLDSGGDVFIDKKQLFKPNSDQLKAGEKLNDLNQKCVFWFKRDGYLYYVEDNLTDLLAIYILRILQEKIAICPIDSEKAIEMLENAEEAFYVDSEKGIISLFEVNGVAMGNSRFYANYLRNYLE
ncbi:hypothetical protein GF376_01110 [Candidatus Peregrinibacteria bacterium]|nr:hypothetical protein [Candidatus Peregrinibacteria bacterium]